MKMTRKQIRETLFLLLFRSEFHSASEMKEQTDCYFEEHPEIEEKDREYIENKLDDILEKMEELDRNISDICQGWRLNRLGKAELTLLRLSVYEILEDEDIPTGVAINEAVRIAKIYCGEDAAKFVNGVLAKMA